MNARMPPGGLGSISTVWNNWSACPSTTSGSENRSYSAVLALSFLSAVRGVGGGGGGKSGAAAKIVTSPNDVYSLETGGGGGASAGSPSKIRKLMETIYFPSGATRATFSR